MPKIVTEEDKALARGVIRGKTEELIKEIGIKNITITGICNAVPVGKGTFYYYYESKEILLYEILLNKEKRLFTKIIEYGKCDISVEEKIIKALTEVYIGEGSIVNLVTPEDFQNIISKLPQQYIKDKEVSSKNYFEAIINTLSIEDKKCDMGVLGEMLDAVNFLASRKGKYGEEVKKEAIQMLIKSIAQYMVGKEAGNV